MQHGALFPLESAKLKPRGGVDLRQGGSAAAGLEFLMWKPIATAPYDRDLELAVLDKDGAHALAFPCRRIAGGWIGAQDRRWLDVRPSHWREWGTGNPK
jgi:hypothetical protein